MRGRLAAPFHRWSLTWRLIAVLVVLLLGALTVSNVATGVLMKRYLTARAADELQIASTTVSSQVLEQYRWRDADEFPSSYAVAIMTDSGQVLRWMSPASRQYQPALPHLAEGDPRVESNTPFVVPSNDDDGPRWLVRAGHLQNDTGLYAVATSLRGVDQTVGRLTIIATVLGAFLLVGCVLVGWLGFRRAFRPLRVIEDTAAAIAGGDLTRRIPERPANDEVTSLSASLNAMLAQIESSFAVREASQERMRRFVTDASHELRTPLATVRGYAELYRQGAASSPEAVAAAMRRIEGEATRMSGLVEDLLTLARLDNRRPMQMGDVDLTVLAADAVQDARARTEGRQIRVLGLDDDGLAPTILPGDEARLRQVVTNLLANALTHTPDGTAVEVLVGSRDGRARLEVRDHGPGIPADEARRVFERFYRNDPARGRRESGGHGLGLAIVAAIVESHHGRVGVARTAGGGATFVVDLPLAARGPTPPEPT